MQETQVIETTLLITSLRERYYEFHDAIVMDDARASYRPAPDEWSIKEIVGHVGDGLELFTSHIIHIATGKPGILPAYDEAKMVRERHHQYQPFTQLIVRESRSQKALERVLRALPAECWTMTAEHESWQQVSIYQLVQLLIAHYHIHIAQIQQIQQKEGA